MKLDWTPGEVECRCPVCDAAGAKERVVSTDSTDPERPRIARIELVRCPDCGSLFVPGGGTPDYTEDADAPEAVQYYVEHLAAIDTIVDPLFKIDRAGIRRYAEIGCSFGFSLDFARTSFGWDVRGIEPSKLGRTGAELLGLPIDERYFDEEHPLGGEPVDLLLAAEVLEHIPDPHGFMRAIAASIMPAAIVILTTPNAAAVRPDADPGQLVQSICPGYHLVLYTEASLARLVERHGFAHHHCRTTEAGLTIYASREPFAFDPDRWTDRALYVAYLEQRLAGAAPGSALARGMLYRLIREHSLYGHWAKAEAFLPTLFAAYAEQGFDLANPDTVRSNETFMWFAELARRYPLNLGGIFHALGHLELTHRRDERRAVAYFDAESHWVRRCHEMLKPAGIDDAEARHFERQGQLDAIRAEMQYDPAATLSRLRRFEADAPDTPVHVIAQLRRDLFVALVNRGDHAGASRLAAAVLGELSLEAPGALPAEDECRGSYAVGIYALLHLNDRKLARSWLQRAAELLATAPDSPAVQNFGAAASRALVHAADADAPAGRLRRLFGKAGA